MTGLEPGLYRQREVWAFEPATVAAGIDPAPFYSHGAAVADFDNDGFPDVLITGYGGLLLFQNSGDGTFTERAAPSGLNDALWSSSAAWGDVNQDGQLDLYVAHYANWSFENNPLCEGAKPGLKEICAPRRFDALPDVFYFNSADGSFRDASADVGLRQDGKGLGVVMADVDVDGHIDVYVGNDTVPNFLYHNDGHGKLLEVGLPSGTSLNERGTPDGSMGVDVGDFNLDGLPDIWVANYENESFALYRNDERCFFQHVSQSTGVTAIGSLRVGWGTAFLDFDGDGDEDVVASNGHVIRYPANAPVRQTPLLLENKAGRRFVDVAPAAGPYFAEAHMGRGLAIGDIDRDGDPDIVVAHTNEPAALLSNETDKQHGWLGLRLVGTHSNRDAIGAFVTLTTSNGSRQTRQIKGGTSYASTSDRRILFGLGRDASVDAVRIRWPSGVEQTMHAPAINRYIDLIEPITEMTATASAGS